MIFPNEYKLQDNIYYPDNFDHTSFKYSDGQEFEKQVYDIIDQAKDKSIFSKDLVNAHWDWSSKMHLSPIRVNLLRPLEFLKNKKILELGSGLGITTRYFGEIGADVLSLEASKLRAQSARLRTHDLPNVRVVCDRIENFNSKEKFDVVTLIGVLQYARIFADYKKNAEIQLLEHASRQLNEDGILIISIQNKLGLKYFGGYPEPNIGISYFGLENQYNSKSMVRFSLKELKQTLALIGLEYTKLLIPLPDYHMPVTILNPDLIKEYKNFKVEHLLALSTQREKLRPDWGKGAPFAMEKVWQSITDAGLIEDLANSFLILATKSEKTLKYLNDNLNALAYHYSVERSVEFATEKKFIPQNDSIITSKKLLNPLTDCDKTLPITLHCKEQVYVSGHLWWLELVNIVNNPDWQINDCYQWSKKWIEFILSEADSTKDSWSLEDKIPGIFYDATPLNFIEDNFGKLHFIDKEWELHENLPLVFVLIRGLFGSFACISNCAKPNACQTLNIKNIIFDLLKMHDFEINNSHYAFFAHKEFEIQTMLTAKKIAQSEQVWLEELSLISLKNRHEIELPVIVPKKFKFRKISNNIYKPLQKTKALLKAFKVKYLEDA